MVISLDMVQTLTLAVAVLFFGVWLKKIFPIFDRFVIPSPVVGGIFFAIIHLVFYMTDTLHFELDMTLKTPLMLVFFAAMGYSADLRLIKRGGKGVIIFFIMASLLMVLQNAVGVGISMAMGDHPFIGLLAGSMSMTGGHSTVAAWAPTLSQEFGLTGANTIGAAAATFGLVSGSLIGAPLGKSLIERYNLKPVINTKVEKSTDDLVESHQDGPNYENIMRTIAVLLISVVLGSLSSTWIGERIPGLILPPAVMAMAFSAVFRNLFSSKIGYYEKANGLVADVTLNIFLALALIELNLWELEAVAGTLFFVLVGQAVLMALFAIFGTFRSLGKDFDAAVIAAGHTGFGMGAVPNGIANMQSLVTKFGPAPRAFFILPIVGMLCDFANMFILTFFINVLS